MKNIDPQNIKLDQLAQYRRSLELSSQQVADQIKVSRSIVVNLEKGHFEKVGAAPFVRGHMTNYCKVLGLDAALILAQIPGQVLAHQNVQRPDAFLPRSVSKVRRQTNRIGRYALGTSLLSVLALSGYFVWDKWALFQSPDAIQLNQNEPTVTYSSIIPPVTTVDQSKPQSNQSADEAMDEANKEAAEAVPNLAAESVTPEPALPTESGDETPTNASDDQVLATAAEAAQPVEASDAQFVIEFELQEEAWVSIKTEAGENVIHDLIGPGPRRYESNEPMRMRIGNADKLTMTINGETVDLAPHTSKNLAKLNWPNQ